MTNNRKSVETNSLRLRPVCNFQPSGPSSSTRAFSTKWWTSSAVAPNDSSHAESVFARSEILSSAKRLFHFCPGENADGLQRFGPGAIDGNLVRQEAAIERKGTLERVELFIRFALKASAPQPIVFAFGHFVLVGQAFLPVPVFVARQIPRTDKNVSPTYFLQPLLWDAQLPAMQTN